MTSEGAAEDRPRFRAASVPADPRPAGDARTVGESELARRFRDRLRLFAVRRLRDETAAEDVVQETLRRVLEALRQGRLDEPEALPAYVFQTARHVCSRRHRSATRKRRALDRLSRFLPWERQEDPLTELIAEERRREVRRALRRLRESDAELLQMFYYQGKSTDEVARTLGISRGAARVRKHRALRRLWEVLEEGRVPRTGDVAAGTDG